MCLSCVNTFPEVRSAGKQLSKLNWKLAAGSFGLLVAFPTLMYHIPWLMEDSEKRKQSAMGADPEAGSARPGGDEKSSNLGGKAERAMSALAVGTVLVGG